MLVAVSPGRKMSLLIVRVTVQFFVLQGEDTIRIYGAVVE